MSTIYRDIEEWIFTFLSEPNSVFGDLSPCPFAKKAWLENKVKVIEVKTKLETEVKQSINNWPKDLEVVLFVMNPRVTTPDYLENVCNKYSDEKFVLLSDHPDREEKVKDVLLNQGKYALVFIQLKKQLEEARQVLKQQGYYKNFTKEYLKAVQGR